MYEVLITAVGRHNVRITTVGRICEQLFTSDKGKGKCFCPCLSVCLSVNKITQKRAHGFGWNVQNTFPFSGSPPF